MDIVAFGIGEGLDAKDGARVALASLQGRDPLWLPRLHKDLLAKLLRLRFADLVPYEPDFRMMAEARGVSEVDLRAGWDTIELAWRDEAVPVRVVIGEHAVQVRGVSGDRAAVQAVLARIGNVLSREAGLSLWDCGREIVLEVEALELAH